MAVIKYTSKRPDEELDGIQEKLEHFTSGSPTDVIVVAVVSRHGIQKVDPSTEWQPTIRFKQVEPLHGDAADQATKLLLQAYTERTGNQALELDFDNKEEKDG